MRPGPVRLHATALVGLLCAGALLSGCGSEGSESADDPETGEQSSAPQPPEVGGCHDLTADQLLESADSADPVDCSEDHTTQTVHVGTFKPAAQGKPAELTEDQANRRASDTCRTQVAAYVGAPADQLWVTQVQAFWFVPTAEEVGAGADWLRCDVVALERVDELLTLPQSMKGALKDTSGKEEFGLCGTTRPGGKKFERVICSQKHAWRAVSVIGVGGGATYPGSAAVRQAGEAECEDQVRTAQGDSLQFDYGWEWPTKDQWEAGQRHGLCWAPA